MADRKDINPRRPIPSSQYDKLRDNLSTNFRVPGVKSFKYKKDTLKRL